MQIFSTSGREQLMATLPSTVAYADREDLFSRTVVRVIEGRCRAEHVGAVYKWMAQDMRFRLYQLLDQEKLDIVGRLRERAAVAAPSAEREAIGKWELAQVEGLHMASGAGLSGGEIRAQIGIGTSALYKRRRKERMRYAEATSDDRS